MFKEEIHVDKKTDVRYGTTTISPTKTRKEIEDILRDHDVDEIITKYRDGKHELGFVYEDIPYLITVPKVYVKDKYNEKIGIRIVKYYLEILLDWQKEAPIDLEQAMLPFRVVEIDGKRQRLGELSKDIPSKNIFGNILSDNIESLPEREEDVIEVERVEE